MDSAWSLLQNGQFIEANEKYTEEYKATNSDSSLRNRAMSFMLLKKYNNALEDYLTILNKVDEFYINNKHYQDNIINKGDGDYIDVGVAYWLLGEYEQAVKMWMDSMTLKLRFTNNIVIPPCIVYFSGVYLKDSTIIKEVKKHLKRYYKNLNLLVKYMLDEIGENDLLDTVKSDSPLKERTLCKYEFYIASKHLEQGYKEGFIEHLKRCRDIKGKYLEFEYFLAVGELDKIIVP